MRKKLLALCVAMVSCIAFAQYKMVVVLKDGTEVKYQVADVDSIRIEDGEEIAAVPVEETGLRFVYDDVTMTATVTYHENLNFKKGNYESAEITIPLQVLYDGKTYDVTKIGKRAFMFCESLTSINIPNSVTEIEDEAFTYCESLTSIVIPSSVTKMGVCFGDCTSLASVEIPNSITEIEYNTFYSCKSLTSIEIPNSVTEIGQHAFASCEALKKARVPKGCTLGEYAFPSTCEIEWY